jgi:hypothetical protein
MGDDQPGVARHDADRDAAQQQHRAREQQTQSDPQ